MCNLYSITRGQAPIRALFRIARDNTGNLPPMPGVFPDYDTPIVRVSPEGREPVLARWGMPSPVFALKVRTTDPGVTNVRNVKSPHWRRWLGEGSRCVVPMPVILRTDDEVEAWLRASAAEALALQRPLSDDALQIVPRGERKDNAAGP